MNLTKDDVNQLRELCANAYPMSYRVLIPALLDEIERLQSQITEIADEMNTAPEHIIEIIRELHDRIAELEAENRWIPVSERFPDGNGFYEVTIKDLGSGSTYTNKQYFHTAIGWDLYYGVVVSWRKPRG